MLSAQLQWSDWVGFAGALMVLGGYFLLQAGKLSGVGLGYQLLNLLGAIGVMVAVVLDFNAPVFFMQVAWILISLYGLGRGIGERRRAAGARRDPGQVAS